jgi:hypothetical protein
MLPTALLLFLLAVPRGAGALHILVEPGDEIFLDARSVGLSSEAASGMLLDDVPAGEHDLEIVTPGGARTSMKVNIFDGQVTTINISSIGLRAGHPRGEDATVELQVVTQSRRCELIVGDQHIAGAKDDLRVEHLKPGKQHIGVICGAETAEGDIDIPAGGYVIVAPDFASGKVHVATQHSRIITMSVPTPEDAIMELQLPLQWKRAIAESLVTGVHAEAITRDRGLTVIATFTSPDWVSMMKFLRQLRRQDEVSSVEALRYWSIANGIRARFEIAFRSE